MTLRVRWANNWKSIKNTKLKPSTYILFQKGQYFTVSIFNHYQNIKYYLSLPTRSSFYLGPDQTSQPRLYWFVSLESTGSLRQEVHQHCCGARTHWQQLCWSGLLVWWVDLVLKCNTVQDWSNYVLWVNFGIDMHFIKFKIYNLFCGFICN